MRPILAAIAFCFALLLPLAASADEAANQAAIDQLFAQLRVAPDAETAETLSEQIWAYWFNPADTVLAGRMSDVSIATSRGDAAKELDLLNGIIADYPDYAEGWNQRATLYYLLGDYDKSLADIAKTLELEPRHYGALAGRVMIELKQGHRNLALRDMIAALAIHPFLGEKQLFPELQQNVTHV